MHIFNIIMTAESIVIKLIKKYLKESGKKAFTYSGLRYYYYKNKVWRDLGVKYDWHTIERTIRKLCEIGVIRRKKLSKNKVIFFLNEEKSEEYIFYHTLSILQPITLPDGRVIVKMNGITKIFNSKDELINFVKKNLRQFLHI